MEEDPQCWRTAPRVMSSSTDTMETTTDSDLVTESTSNHQIFYVESETDEKIPEQSSSSRSHIQSAHETAQNVCPSDIPLDWFCDNQQARFNK